MLLIALLSVLYVKAQRTYVPDNNFEQALINLSLDDIFDDSVTTSAIDTLSELYLSNRNISSLIGIEDFVGLQHLFCSNNQIVTLDLSKNSNLIELNCRENLLVSLDMRNGNNLGLLFFTAKYNSYLQCITVDDINNANANWDKDNSCVFSDNCSAASIEIFNKEKKVIKIIDTFGRETKSKINTPMFYIYNDGTMEKKVFVE